MSGKQNLKLLWLLFCSSFTSATILPIIVCGYYSYLYFSILMKILFSYLMGTIVCYYACVFTIRKYIFFNITNFNLFFLFYFGFFYFIFNYLFSFFAVIYIADFIDLYYNYNMVCLLFGMKEGILFFFIMNKSSIEQFSLKIKLLFLFYYLFIFFVTNYYFLVKYHIHID